MSKNHSRSKKQLPSPTVSTDWRWWQWAGLIVGSVSIISLLFVWQGASSYLTFLDQTTLDTNQLFALWRRSRETEITMTQERVNVLLLGTDNLEYRRDSLPLTDTIMLVSLDIKTGTIYLLPLPRDLYIASRGTRINAIYPQFYQDDPESAAQQTGEVVSQLLEIPMTYTVVVDMSQVSEFIDMIGGVDVEVKTSFTDERYPRDDVDIAVVHDPALLYETISFDEGPRHLDGKTAIKFMRSRHAQNSEGSDFARSARQQQVLTATTDKVAEKLKQEIKTYDFSFLGQLYEFYRRYFQQQLPFEQVLAIAERFLTQGQLPTLVSDSITIGGNGYVRENVDYTLQIVSTAGLKQEIKQKLGFNGD